MTTFTRATRHAGDVATQGAVAAALAVLAGVLVLVAAGGQQAANAATGPQPPGPHSPALLRPGLLHTDSSGARVHADPVGRAGSPASTSAVGSVLGWGQDSYGQLGNGATAPSETTPVNVNLPAGTDITQVAAGYDHSLAVTSGGGMLAFGHNDMGQLGNGSTQDSNEPVDVSLPSSTTVTQAAAGYKFSLAVTSAGGVLAWGDNQYGQLGNGQTSTSPVQTPNPVSLPSGTTVTQVAASSYESSYALTAAGTVYAWGYNYYGQLGDGNTNDSDVPVRVSLPSGTTVTQLAVAGPTAYALTSGGAVYAWGLGINGELGDGSLAGTDVPVKVSLPSGTTVTQIAAGGASALALTSTHHVLAWGLNSSGQLGDGNTTMSDVPVTVSIPSDTTVTQVAEGGDFGAAATSTGAVLAWGDNAQGELGNGAASGSDVPVQVSLPSGVRIVSVSAGEYHALALPAPAPQVTSITPEDGLAEGGGKVTVTGSGFTGATAVRFGATTAASVKVVSDSEITATVPAGTGRKDVTVTTQLGGTSAASPADQYTYLAKGSVLDWGHNQYGELGNGQTIDAPVPVAAHLPAGTVVTQTAGGEFDSYALTSTGTVYAWGNGGDGELGDGTGTSSDLPVKVSIPADTTVTAITAGIDTAYALTSTGQVLAWGDGTLGELGDGTTSVSDAPVLVSLPSGTKVTQLAAEGNSALALTSTGQVLAWGSNQYGQLGNGTTADSDAPVYVSLPTGATVSSIGGAYYSGYAVTSTGNELAWGKGDLGQLGNGATADIDVPVAVFLPGGTKVIAATGGTQTGYALTSTGGVLAWGDGFHGQLGNGTISQTDIPVAVQLPSGTKVATLSALALDAMARTTGGGLLAWGYNADGELGNGSTEQSNVPVGVHLPAGVSATQVALSAGFGGIAVVNPVTVVTRLNPSRGTTGSTVTITGLNLAGATKVVFGKAVAKFTLVSGTKILAIVPAGTGTVAVRVTTPLGTSATVSVDKYTYSG